MKARLLTQQSIPNSYNHNYQPLIRYLYKQCAALSLTTNGVGDCIETDMEPNPIRRMGGYKDMFLIRRMGEKTWYIWRKK